LRIGGNIRFALEDVRACEDAHSTGGIPCRVLRTNRQ
jgi:hypothetical protein